MTYRYVATSIEGFVQQLAVSYLSNGYWFYVAGRIPDGKDPAAVDLKLIKRYGIDISKWARARRKQAGFANMQYLRHENIFLLLATHGRHRFFEDERELVRDARRVPIKFATYAISYRNGHPSVRIELEEYKRVKAYMVELASHHCAKTLAHEFGRLPFEPYAPVRRQLVNIWRAANQARQAAGFEGIPHAAVRWRRRTLKPFDDSLDSRRLEES